MLAGCIVALAAPALAQSKLGYRTLPENVTMVVGAATAAILVEAAVCSLLGARNDC